VSRTAPFSIDLLPEPDLTLPHLASALRATARFASVLPVAVGTLVLIGWAIDVEALKRVLPGLSAMNPTSAVGFVVLGCALALTTGRGGPWVRRLTIALAAIVVLFGTSRLIALAGLWDPPLDRLVFREKLDLGDPGRISRMAPNTAINFILCGVALVLLDRQRSRFRSLAQLLSLITGMTALLALLGYSYGLPQFYGIGSQKAMSLPTAVTFLVFATGLLCARPKQGIMAVISSRSSGGTMVRRLLPAVLIVPAVFGALRLAGQRAEIFDTPFGLWLLVVTIMTVLAVLVGWNAHLLFRSDIDRSNAEKMLAFQATHDALTQLPNRRLFIQRLAEDLSRPDRNGTLTAVLFVDLDLFKVINDSLGHGIGDELLIAAGRRIRENVGDGDLVGRLSGDEFTVLIPALHEHDRAIVVADRIRNAFDVPFAIGLHEVFTSVSVGIAFADGGEAPVDVIRQADIAMYRAKARGKARWEIFDPSMDADARQRQRLETDLRQAIARGELRVYYQPEVEIETGRLVGMEALVRWEHPERGLISPAQFIALAEETGLIVPIGRWVLLEACRKAKEWQTLYRRDLALMVSVNLSGKHLQQAGLIQEVREVIETTGINPAHLIIEITETVAMAGAETTIEILRKLKSLGVLLAIDDFGTGFSSLAYLKRFPVDLLKIDKSFVDGVANRGHDTAIVEAIISLGHALGLKVIAEGVETSDQLLELRSLGSELGQGYFFGQPLSGDGAAGMPSLLEAHQRWNAERP
jgi:diguanylate cyclase (GGDEF)-like protein